MDSERATLLVREHRKRAGIVPSCKTKLTPSQQSTQRRLITSISPIAVLRTTFVLKTTSAQWLCLVRVPIVSVRQ